MRKTALTAKFLRRYRKHSLMINTDFIENKKIDDTKTPLKRFVLIISKVKSGNVLSTAQNMNNQSFTNLQFKNLLKNSFHYIELELRDSTCKKKLFVSVRITRVVLFFRKISNNHFLFGLLKDGSSKFNLFPIFRGHARQRRENLVLFRKLLGELQST